MNFFNVFLRPVVEFCNIIYHPMLTCEMNENLERQQKRAMKVIFGFDLKYSEVLEMYKIKTLEQRREEACASFAKKLVASNRFKNLFPLNDIQEEAPQLRQYKLYKEEFARSERLYRSPLFTMRRFMNSI